MCRLSLLSLLLLLLKPQHLTLGPESNQRELNLARVREHVVGGPRGDGVPRRREQRDHAGRDIKRKDGEARLIFFLVFVWVFYRSFF